MQKIKKVKGAGDLARHVSDPGAKIKARKTGRKIPVTEAKLTPPGAADAEAAALLSPSTSGSDKPPDSTIKAGPTRTEETKEPGLMAMIADEKNVAALFVAFNSYIGKRAPIWVLEPEEISGLSKALPPVLKKYLPESLEYLPEILLIEVLAGIILPRIMASRIGELVPKPVEVPPAEVKPAEVKPGPVFPDLKIDLSGIGLT